ncbi:MAG: T9SS type A sorting domain-containing protein [candidate division WOR-3 bacterium]
MRFPLVMSYTWQVVDTCIQPAGRMVPIMDLDADGISDSLFVDSSNIGITFVSTDSVKIETDTITVIFKLTRPMILYADSSDTIMHKNFKHTFKFILRGKYLPYIGYEYLRSDTAEYIYEYDYIRTSTSDSLHASANITLSPFYIRELIFTKVAEKPIKETKGQVYELYDVNGRLICRGKGALYNTQKLPKGVYFVRVGKRVKKVISK